MTSRLRLARRDFKEAWGRLLAHNRDAYLLPLGLGSLPGRELLAALSRHAQAWIARVRSALGRVLMKVKAMSASTTVSAGLTVALGAVVVPPIQASASAMDLTPKIAVIPAAVATPAPPSSSAPLPAESAKATAKPDDGAAAEQRSLRRIQSLLKSDETAALAALERHKKVFVFPFEHHPEERASVEERVRMKLAAQRRAHPGAAPP